MMRGIISSMDGWWRCVCVMQCCYRTASRCWVSSGSSTYQGTNETMSRMRWMSSGIVTVMMRHLRMNNIYLYLNEVISIKMEYMQSSSKTCAIEKIGLIVIQSGIHFYLARVSKRVCSMRRVETVQLTRNSVARRLRMPQGLPADGDR